MGRATIGASRATGGRPGKETPHGAVLPAMSGHRRGGGGPGPAPAELLRLVTGRRSAGGATGPRRETLHAAPGRAAERVARAPGVEFLLKWRDGRPDDREALLYQGLAPTVLGLLGLLGAPRLLG